MKENSNKTAHNDARKMKEMRRLCVYIVYAIPQSPQDIVDKRTASGRTIVEKLQIVKKIESPKKP